MRILFLLLLSFPALAADVVLENEYVRVTRDGTSCSGTQAAECADRVIIALDALELAPGGPSYKLARGGIAVFGVHDDHAMPAGHYFEVAIKKRHPPALAPRERIAPEKNSFLHEGADYFVFEEKLAPGDTRPRHSHSQRVVVQLERARLQQWPDGEPDKVVETVPDKPVFSAPVVHVVKNIGDAPLRGIIVEFKPE